MYKQPKENENEDKNYTLILCPECKTVHRSLILKPLNKVYEVRESEEGLQIHAGFFKLICPLSFRTIKECMTTNEIKTFMEKNKAGEGN